MSTAEPCGKKFPPKLIPKMNAIKRGIEENPEEINDCKTGIKMTVTGRLSRKPERIDVNIKIKIDNRKISSGEIRFMKSSIILIIPTTSKQYTKTKRQIKKKISL